jgi:hypothetical protein
MKIGAQVKKIVVAAVAVLTLSHASHAEERHALHGLFCNAEAQLEQTLGHLRLGLSPQLAAEQRTGEVSSACMPIGYAMSLSVQSSSAKCGTAAFYS